MQVGMHSEDKRCLPFEKEDEEGGEIFAYLRCGQRAYIHTLLESLVHVGLVNVFQEVATRLSTTCLG